MEFDVMKIPNGSSGPWKVSEITLTKEDVWLENLRSISQPGARIILPGKYKRLTRHGKVILSNTSAEISDFRPFTRRAYGRVLINGLGLGCTVAELLNKPGVNSVEVVEISYDVIRLVADFFKPDPRFILHHEDAFKFKPPRGARFDFIWHDIWDDICSDNLPQMSRLHRKYGRRVEVWQASWCRELCRAYARR
jgi:hypothetical protein